MLIFWGTDAASSASRFLTCKVVVMSLLSRNPSFALSTVNASTGRYITLRGGATTPDLILEVTTPTGAEVPASVRAQVTVLRIR